MLKIAIKNWKQRLLRVLCRAILVCAVSIAVSFVSYWFARVFFDFEFDPLGLSVTIAFFGVGLALTFSTVGLTELGGTRLLHWIDAKFQHNKLLTRYILRQFAIRLGFTLMLASVLVMIPLGPERPLSLLVVLFVGIFLVFTGMMLISLADVALALLKKFRTGNIQDFKDLNHGLKFYNRAVDFRFSNKKLFAITQYARHIYALKLRKEKEQFQTKLDEMIKSLESRDYGEIPETLKEMAEDVDTFLKNYEKLGIEIKPPILTRALEAITSALQKVFPQVLWILILILIYLVLRVFIPIEISIP